jgi:hypothetical protein
MATKPAHVGGGADPAPAARPVAVRKERKKETVTKALVERRYHQTVRRIDVWSVLKVSICFYTSAVVVMLTAAIVVWFVADTAGLVHSLEKFVSQLLFSNDTSFHLLPGTILKALTLIGLVFVCLTTIFTVLAAAFYNLFAELVGGVEITVAEDV